MKTKRYATTRQKACIKCSAAKARCDRKAGACGRCAQRGLSCTYPSRSSLQNSMQHMSSAIEADVNDSFDLAGSPSTYDDLSFNPIDFTLSSESAGTGLEPAQTPSGVTTLSSITSGVIDNCEKDVTSNDSKGSHALNFVNLELVCPISADDISNRWLNTYLPMPGQKIKTYPTNVTTYIHRILQSYANVIVNGRGFPSFLHPLQKTVNAKRTPLATCRTLARLCQEQSPSTEDVVFGVLQREMTNLYEQHESCDALKLLELFQAYLIYTMMLFFKARQTSGPFLRQAMTNLQHLACSSSKGGLVCVAEQQNARPTWEAWIIAEAKRRSLFVMYLFDNLLSAQEELPTFLGTELQGLFAPCSRTLWRADARQSWEMAYNSHLADWPEGPLRIEELWLIPPDFNENDIRMRQDRVDRWLENVDEFGTMLYAVTCCTHGD